MSLRPASSNQINRISQPSYNNYPQVRVVSTRSLQPISNSHSLLPQQETTSEVTVEKCGTIVAITQRVNINEKVGTKRTYNNKLIAKEPQLLQIGQDQLSSYQEPQASIRETLQIQQTLHFNEISQPFKGNLLHIRQFQSSENQFSQLQQSKPQSSITQYSPPLDLLSCQPSQQIKISSEQQSQYRINEIGALNQDSTVKQMQQVLYMLFLADP
jgi:hypothetical protein